jgi:beta-glucosidase
VTVKEGIKNLLPDAYVTVAKGCTENWDDFDVSGFDEAVNTAKNADIVVLCLGESQEYSGEGNCRADLDLPGVQNELASAVIAANPNTAVLLFNGRPLSITKLDKIAPAILDMWFPGTEGGSAAASLLFGDANPQGKLSITFPKTVGQCPIYYNHPSTARPKDPAKDNERVTHHSSYVDCGNLPLYSFGHGLSYSNFLYESMTLSSEKITKEDRRKYAAVFLIPYRTYSFLTGQIILQHGLSPIPERLLVCDSSSHRQHILYSRRID